MNLQGRLVMLQSASPSCSRAGHCRVWLNNPHGHAAVDGQVFSSDEVILDQIQNRAGNILRFAFAMKRNPVLDIVLHLLRREHVLEVSANDPWRDAIQAYIVVRSFPHCCVGKPRQGSFCHFVRRRPEAAAVAGCRTDEYSCAFPCSIICGAATRAKCSTACT